MERSDLALRRARRAYETTHVAAGVRALGLAAGLCVLAIGLHRITSMSWLVAALLAATLATLAWRGGAYRRGALAGVLAGLPPLVVPSIVFAMSHPGHCTGCATGASWPCMLACLGTSALVGVVVGHRASADRMPRAFGLSAIATAALTGLLGCGTVGLGGALGVVAGLVAGGVAGWVVAGRTARA